MRSSSATVKALLALAILLVSVAIPAHGQEGSLRGVVVDSAGEPVPAADVGIAALRRLTKTDELGRFLFTKVPPGKIELSVRRLSYQPRSLQVAITAGRGDSVRVTLLAHPAFLQTVDVAATQIRHREMVEDFYRRQIRGMGKYITREEIDARWGGTPSDLLRTTPGVRLIRNKNGGYAVRFPNTSLRRFDCAPMIWLDGQRAPGLEIDDLTLRDLEGIEVYNGPATTPMQFSQSQAANTCGTIVVWSRPPTPRTR